MNTKPGLASRIAIFPLRGLIVLYKYGLSPFFTGSCRYHPGCSAYADEALRVHGPVRGLALAIRRIARCHPWGGSGLDPVPPANSTGEMREGSIHGS